MAPATLILGLGNPSSKYERTRHNVGREFIDFLAAQAKAKFKSAAGAEIVKLSDSGLVSDQPVVCAKLTCYMNESGPSLQGLLASERLSLNQSVIILDDFMLPFGTLRLRSKGSAGGHNGLKSIIETFGTEDFARFRVGIGPVPAGEDPADFVLKKFSKEEQGRLPSLFDAIRSGLSTLLKDGVAAAMNTANKAHLES